MFIKCKNLDNGADLYFNKDQIRLIEDMTVSTVDSNRLTLKIHYNKEDMRAVSFDSYDELHRFLKEVTE